MKNGVINMAFLILLRMFECVGGLDGDWTPLPTRPQQYCYPASLVFLKEPRKGRLKVLIHDQRDRPSTAFQQFIDVEENETVFIGVSMRKLKRVQSCTEEYPSFIDGKPLDLEDPW